VAPDHNFANLCFVSLCSDIQANITAETELFISILITFSVFANKILNAPVAGCVIYRQAAFFERFHKVSELNKID